MKKLKLKYSNVKEVLSREQLRQVVGGHGTSDTGGDQCAGVWFFCTTPEGCGYAIGIGRIYDACMVSMCQVDTPHPCAFA